MKRLFVLLLAFMMLFAFVACDDNTPNPPVAEEPDTPTTPDTPVDPDTPNPVVEKWDGTASTEWFSSETSSFTLETPEQLAGLAELVSEGTDFSGKTITLSNDMDLDNKEWTPIGTAEHPFTGTVDGGEITISNLKMSKEIESTIQETNDQKVAGFIGFLAAGGVRNLNFSNVSIDVGQDVAVGVVAGFMNGGSIDSVTVDKASLSGKYKSDMGGIVGKLYDDGSVTNNKVTDTSIVVDAENSSYESCNVGGVVGSFSHEGDNSENKKIEKNIVNLSGNSEAKLNLINYQEAPGYSLPVGGIIGQIGIGTEGTVSDNELIIADVNQIAGGKGSILVGYPQEFYGFSNNKGSCGNQSWENEENYDSARVDVLLPEEQA